MNNKLIVLSIVSLFISGCRAGLQEPQIISFKPVKSITLEAEKGRTHFPNYYKQRNDSGFLTLTNNKELISYHLETGKKIEQINIDFFDYADLAAINYHNRDSIFLVYNAASLSPYHHHDSVFMMIDNKGDIKEIFSFKGLPVPAAYNDPEPFENLVGFPGSFQTIPVSNNKLFFNFFYFGRMGEPDFNANKRPLGGYFDLETKQFELYEGLDSFPYVKNGQVYPPSSGIVFLSVSKQGNPMLGFCYTPMLYHYDIKSKTLSKPRITSHFADTIRPHKTKYRNYSDKSQAEYRFLFYDKYRNRYYRNLRLPVPDSATPYRSNKPKQSLLMADENFNVIAEGILPDSVDAMLTIITEEGIWFKNRSNKNAIQLDLYKFELKKSSKEKLDEMFLEKTKTELQNFGVDAYMKNYIDLPSNASVLVVPVDLGCNACAKQMAEFYSRNQSIFTDTTQYIVLAGISKYTMEPFLQSLDISEKMPHLYIDKKGEYLNYFYDFNNPRLFILEDNKIIHDEVYEPADLYRLEEQLKAFSNKK